MGDLGRGERPDLSFPRTRPTPLFNPRRWVALHVLEPPGVGVSLQWVEVKSEVDFFQFAFDGTFSLCPPQSDSTTDCRGPRETSGVVTTQTDSGKIGKAPSLAHKLIQEGSIGYERLQKQLPRKNKNKIKI